MPLSGYGLWEAEITAPASKPCCRTRYATAGVGITPAITTLPPTEQMPAANALSSIEPEIRVSRPIKNVG